MRYFIDTALAGGAANRLLATAGLFLLVALVTQALAVAATYAGENVAWTATNCCAATWPSTACASICRSTTGARPAEMIERVDGDVTALASFFSRFVISILGSGILLVGALGRSSA